MFGIPGKPAVTLTEAAANQIQKLWKKMVTMAYELV